MRYYPGENPFHQPSNLWPLPEDWLITIVPLKRNEIGQEVLLPAGSIALDVVTGPALLVQAPSKSVAENRFESRTFYMMRLPGVQPDMKLEGMNYVGCDIGLSPTAGAALDPFDGGCYSGFVVWEPKKASPQPAPELTHLTMGTQ